MAHCWGSVGAERSCTNRSKVYMKRRIEVSGGRNEGFWKKVAAFHNFHIHEKKQNGAYLSLFGYFAVLAELKRQCGQGHDKATAERLNEPRKYEPYWPHRV